MRYLALMAVFLHLGRLCVGCAPSDSASSEIDWDEVASFEGGVDADLDPDAVAVGHPRSTAEQLAGDHREMSDGGSSGRRHALARQPTSRGEASPRPAAG